MQLSSPKITPCLWFDTSAEDAAKLYTSLFPNSRITHVSRYPDAGQDVHGKDAGSAMTVEFELDGRPFVGLNGGPQFTFDEAISFQIFCDSQEEVDHYWNALTDGGQEGQCGWLKDRFGLSWQVIPRALMQLMGSGDAGTSQRVMQAMLQMQKIDIAALEKAAA